MNTKTQSTIKILIADDTELARIGLRGILSAEPDIQVAGFAEVAEQIPELAYTTCPDIVLMDLDWFGDGGLASFDIIRQLKNDMPDLKVIAVTNFTDLIQKARQAGVDAALSKGFSRSEIVTMIRAVYKRESTKPASQEQKQDSEVLTFRELEVLQFMAKGLQDKQIANQLNISTFTVKHHVSSIIGKLRVANRAEAVSEGHRLGSIR